MIPSSDKKWHVELETAPDGCVAITLMCGRIWHTPSTVLIELLRTFTNGQTDSLLLEGDGVSEFRLEGTHLALYLLVQGKRIKGPVFDLNAFEGEVTEIETASKLSRPNVRSI